MQRLGKFSLCSGGECKNMNTWRTRTPGRQGREAVCLVLYTHVHRTVASYDSKIISRPGKIRLKCPALSFLGLGIRMCWSFADVWHCWICFLCSMALDQSLLPVWLSAWVVQSSKYGIFAFFRKRSRIDKGGLVHSFPTELLDSHQTISVYFHVGEKWQQLWRKDWSKLHVFVNLWNLSGKLRNSSERICLSAAKKKKKLEDTTEIRRYNVLQFCTFCYHSVCRMLPTNPIDTPLLFSQTTQSSLWVLGFPLEAKESNWCLLVARFVLLVWAA